jgi:hypothetical protein
MELHHCRGRNPSSIAVSLVAHLLSSKATGRLVANDAIDLVVTS